MPFCTNCGNNLGDNAKFCTKCGKKLVVPPTGTTTPSTTIETKDRVRPSRTSMLLEQKTKNPETTEKIVPKSKREVQSRDSMREDSPSNTSTSVSSPPVSTTTTLRTRSGTRTDSKTTISKTSPKTETTKTETLKTEITKKTETTTTPKTETISTNTTTTPKTETAPKKVVKRTVTNSSQPKTNAQTSDTRESTEPSSRDKVTPSRSSTISSKNTAQIIKQLREYKTRYQVSELKYKETQEKLAKLVQAVKEDRSTRLKDYQSLMKEKEELENRANEAEVAVINIVQKVKENEKRHQQKFQNTLQQSQTQFNLAVNRAKQFEEKFQRLIETMQNVVKQKGGTSGELVGKLAELEQQQNKDLETIDKLKIEKEKMEGNYKVQLEKLKMSNKNSEETVLSLQGNLTKALEELELIKNKMEKQKQKKDDKEYEDEKSQEIIKKLTLKYNKALERLAESEKKLDEQEKTIRSYEDKTSKMVQMVQRNRQEMQNKIDQLTSKLRESSSFSNYKGDVQDKLADALERAEFAETKRQELQQKVTQLEEKLWATEKNLWETEDKSDEQVRQLEAKLLLAQEKLQKLANQKGTTTTAITGEVELTQKQEKMLVKVLKETKLKIQDLETKLKQRTESSDEQSFKQQKRIEQLEKIISEGGSLGMGGGLPGGNLSSLTPEQATKIKKTLQALQERAKKAETRTKELENEIQQLKAGGIGLGIPGGIGGIGIGPPPPPGIGDFAPPPPGIGGDFAPPPPPGMEGEFAPPPPPPGMEGEFAPPPPPPGFEGPPPPPGMLGVPPPPGTGGLGGAGGLKKKVGNIPKPTQSTKSVNWTKIPTRQITKTFWKDIDETVLPIDWEDVERNFSQKVVEKKVVEKTEKKEEVVLISGKREQNVSIFLSTLKRDNDEIRDAILELDDEILSTDRMPQLLECLPTEEELTQIRGWLKKNDNIDQLAKAEKFFTEIEGITELRPRLEAYQFKITFEDRISNIKPTLKTISNALKEIETSKAFRLFCTITLALGNFLNGKTARGGAHGFKLITLSKLADTKSSDNTSNLMQYMIKLCEAKFPEVINITDEMATVSGAAKLSYTSTGGDVAGLKLGLNKMKSALQLIKPTKGDKFHDVIPSSVEEFEPIINEISKDYENIAKRYEVIGNEYGEETKTVPIEEFFQMIDAFYKQWEQAKAEVMKGREVLKKVRKDPLRQKLLSEIQKFDLKKLNKVTEEDKKKKEGGDSILSSIGAIASKIARDRKERQEKKIRAKPSRKKPKESAKLDKILTDIKKMDVNELMNNF